jgi:hypothetical protein
MLVWPEMGTPAGRCDQQQQEYNPCKFGQKGTGPLMLVIELLIIRIWEVMLNEVTESRLRRIQNGRIEVNKFIVVDILNKETKDL